MHGGLSIRPGGNSLCSAQQIECFLQPWCMSTCMTALAPCCDEAAGIFKWWHVAARFHSDCQYPSPSLEEDQPLAHVTFLCNAVGKSKCSCLWNILWFQAAIQKSWNRFHINIFMLSLHFTGGVVSTGRETENQKCMCLNVWHSCCVNVASPRQKSVPGNPSLSEPNGIWCPDCRAQQVQRHHH